MALNGIVQAIGTFNFHSRLMGVCCGMLLSCANLAAIITTGVFRFNTIGNFAALSLCGSKFEKDFSRKTQTMLSSSLSNEHTFNSDARLILWLWLCQMFLCCANCCI